MISGLWSVEPKVLFARETLVPPFLAHSTGNLQLVSASWVWASSSAFGAPLLRQFVDAFSVLKELEDLNQYSPVSDNESANVVNDMDHVASQKGYVVRSAGAVIPGRASFPCVNTCSGGQP